MNNPKIRTNEQSIKIHLSNGLKAHPDILNAREGNVFGAEGSQNLACYSLKRVVELHQLAPTWPMLALSCFW